MNRRMSACLCLLLTAALLLSLPAVLRQLRAGGAPRVSERLRPARQRTLTLWLVNDRTDCAQWLQPQLTAFEKANPGVRVFLRRAEESELYAVDAALPDVLLLGSLTAPERVLRPLTGLEGARAEALACGKSVGLQYAVPLCCAPGVLAVPAGLLVYPDASRAPAPTPEPRSYFSFATATPDPVQPLATRAPMTIPWNTLPLLAPEGVAWQQLAGLCPPAARPALTAALRAQTEGGAPPAAPCARVMTLADYLSERTRDTALTGFALSPAVCDRVLLGALTGNDAQAAALLKHLFSETAQAALAPHGLYPLREGAAGPAADALCRTVSALYQGPLLLPNAFAFTPDERDALCRADFLSGADPVETLLRLR